MLNHNASKFFFKSLAWQTFKDFNLVISDGGSNNLVDIGGMAKEYGIACEIVVNKIDNVFLRAFLNNVGVRNAKTPYIMCTDADMLFAPKFMETLMANVGENVLVESRTMYWKQPMVDMIYSGKIDPQDNIDSCKIGRIKKRTTAGGCQCMHINGWNKIRGYNEEYIGWGSEDFDLLARAGLAGLKIKWMGESLESIMLFHQPHGKDLETLTKELKEQDKNKRLLSNIKTYAVNPNGWGGINEKSQIQ